MLNSVRRICKTLNQARLYIPERCVHCAYVCVILSPSCTLDICCVSFCLSSCAVCVRCVQRCVSCHHRVWCAYVVCNIVSCHHRVWCAYVVCNVVCRCVIIGCGVRMLYVALSPLCVLYIRCVSFCRHRVCCVHTLCVILLASCLRCLHVYCGLCTYVGYTFLVPLRSYVVYRYLLLSKGGK